MARENGYMLTVKMFVPVNPKDLGDTTSKATAIQRAQSENDLSGLAAAGADIMSVAHRFTSREKAEAAVVHTEAQSTEAIAEQAQQGDIEDAIAGPETPEQERERIRAEHAAAEAAAEAEEAGSGAAGSVGEDQSAATEEAASGGTSGRRRRA